MRRGHALLLFLALPPASLRIQDPAPQAGATLDTRAAACGKCHVAIYEQWRASRHAQSWTSETYQAWTKTKRKPERCYKCHIPQSVIPVAPKRPRRRELRLDEGITCASCHVHEGRVHGPRGAKTEAHPSVASELFAAGNVGLCQSCHRIVPKPVISLGKDFEKAGLAAKGKSCQRCHMPEAEGFATVDPETGEGVGKKRMVRSHRFPGASVPAMAKKAFELHRESKDGKLVLRLENKCGHRLPGLTLRSYRVEFTVVGPSGEVVASRKAEITHRKPLPVLGSLRVEFEAPAGAAKARVVVRHWVQRRKKGEPKDLGTVFEAEK